MLALFFVALFERPFDHEHFDIWFNGPRSYSVEAVGIFTQHTCSDNNSLKNLPVNGLRLHNKGISSLLCTYGLSRVYRWEQQKKCPAQSESDSSI